MKHKFFFKISTILLVITTVFDVFLYMKFSELMNRHKKPMRVKISLKNNSTPDVYITGKNHLPPTAYVNPALLIDHKKEIMRINNDLIHLEDGDTDLIKTVKISKFILGKTEELMGDPLPIMDLSYFNVWEKIDDKKLLVNCFVISSMYALFANNANIPTRLVFIRNQGKDRNTYNHAVAESYSRDKQHWYAVDLINKQVFLTDENDRLLNVYEYAKLINGIGTRNLKTYNLKEFYRFGSNKDEYFEASLFYAQLNYKGNPTLNYDIFSANPNENFIFPS